MFTSIESQFWTDEKVKKWDTDARHLAFYLMTTPHRNLIGCYVLPLTYVLEDFGDWNEERLSKALNRLEEDNFARYDPGVQLLCIKNFLRYHPIQNPKHLQGAIKVFSALPHSPILKSVNKILREAATRYEIEFPIRVSKGVSKGVSIPNQLRKKEEELRIKKEGKGKEKGEAQTTPFSSSNIDEHSPSKIDGRVQPPSDNFISTQSQNPESKLKPSPSELLNPGVSQNPDDSAKLQVKGNGEAPASVQIYEELTGHALAKNRWSMMDRTIGENSDALGLWERIVRGWITQGWELKLDVMVCDYFQLGIVPGECRQATPGSCQRTLAGVS